MQFRAVELHYATIIAVPIQNSSFRREYSEELPLSTIMSNVYKYSLSASIHSSSNDTQTIQTCILERQTKAEHFYSDLTHTHSSGRMAKCENYRRDERVHDSDERERRFLSRLNLLNSF
jgi:hypothetical protein